MLSIIPNAGKPANAALVAGQEGKVYYTQQILRSFVPRQIDVAARASRYESCCSMDLARI